MPYSRQTADKSGHAEFVRNPDVQAFLKQCTYLREPSDSEAGNIVASYSPAPAGQPARLPEFVVASDASKSDSPIGDKLPSTQFGFIKVSHVLIVMAKYQELIDPKSRFVDPFKVAEMHRNAQPITFVLPGSNIKYHNAPTVRDGFRKAVYDQLAANRRTGANRIVLSETLLMLNDNQLPIANCPSVTCKKEIGHLVFTVQQPTHPCPHCGKTVYVTDWLRLHEGISDFGDNASAMTRMMNAVEHLLLGAFMLEMLQGNPMALTKVAFVMDGPLALFGEPAKLHPRIMKLMHQVNEKLARLGQEPLLVIGLQKTGIVMDHGRLMQRFLEKAYPRQGVLRVIDDTYRNDYITGSDDPAENFGHESYYGQDFLFKTETGRIFNFALPYPFAAKDGSRADFAARKVELARYGSLLERACDLIRYFELDLYSDAIVPVALAHRHASISLEPGGRVLDLMAREGLR
ncbi:hypothetical protein [Hymenobacter terrenus]|uniref:hypothetical protein n=1 Tax=Hymenobacter terrenus TaxID=1629124 RepID=UPI0006195FD1|nr:hypothetical protein [Hymenobacter terrenus]